MFKRYGGIAQMVERMVRIHEVRGSIPLISTKRVLDEHLLFQRRFCREMCSLILITKAPFREVEAVLLFFLLGLIRGFDFAGASVYNEIIK